MESLFETPSNDRIIERINRLSSESKALWEKMNVSQMLAHCQRPVEVSLGELKLKRGLLAILFGRMVKRSLLKPEPFKQNLPTVPAFRVIEERNFGAEKSRLISLISRFKSGPACLTKEPHPFFGPMTDQEWDLLQWKHLDHHLRQFGV